MGTDPLAGGCPGSGIWRSDLCALSFQLIFQLSLWLLKFN
jgi:hypothetical protein